MRLKVLHLAIDAVASVCRHRPLCLLVICGAGYDSTVVTFFIVLLFPLGSSKYESMNILTNATTLLTAQDIQ